MHHDLPIDRRIGEVAARQQNNVTREQLLSLGLGAQAIVYRARVGRLYREFPGVYSVGRRATTGTEKASAAVLACGRAALSHASGLTHWGVWKRWDHPFEVTLLRGDRRPCGVTVHRSRSLKWQDTVIHNGIRVTKLARTLLDMTPRLTDEELWRTVDNALHTPYVTRGQLLDQLVRNPSHPGTKRLAAYVVATGGPTRSDFERLWPAYCRQHNLPEPIMDEVVRARERDAYWPNEGIVIELDGYRTHSTQRAFEDDRDRDADTLAAGEITVRITWRRLILTPLKEADRLRRIVALRRNQRAA